MYAPTQILKSSTFGNSFSFAHLNQTRFHVLTRDGLAWNQAARVQSSLPSHCDKYVNRFIYLQINILKL